MPEKKIFKLIGSYAKWSMLEEYLCKKILNCRLLFRLFTFNLHYLQSNFIIDLLSRISVRSMDKFLSFNTSEYDPYMFCAPEEEERKVHTPYMEPQDYSLEFYPSFHPISSKI